LEEKKNEDGKGKNAHLSIETVIETAVSRKKIA